MLAMLARDARGCARVRALRGRRSRCRGRLDLFAVLGLPRRLVVDRADLERRYHEPRAPCTRTAIRRRPTASGASLVASARVNRAYRTLRDPVARGRYWLELHGAPLGERNNRGAARARGARCSRCRRSWRSCATARAAAGARRSRGRDVRASRARRAARDGSARRARRRATPSWDAGDGGAADARRAQAPAVGDRVPDARCSDDVEEALAEQRVSRGMTDHVVGIDLGHHEQPGRRAGRRRAAGAADPRPASGCCRRWSRSCRWRGASSARRRARSRAERPFDTILSVKRFMGRGLEHVTDEDRRRYRFVDARRRRRPLPRPAAARSRRRRSRRTSCASSSAGRGGARRAGGAGGDHRARRTSTTASGRRRRTPAGSPGSRCCAS